MKHLLPVLAIAAMATTQAEAQAYVKHPNRPYEYQLFSAKSKNPKPAEGDQLMVHYRLRNANNVVDESYARGPAMPVPMMPEAQTNFFSHPLSLMNAGDSLRMRVPSDSIREELKKFQLDQVFPVGSVLELDYKVESVKSKAEVEAEQAKAMAEQQAEKAKIDAEKPKIIARAPAVEAQTQALIAKYNAKSVKALSTPSGLKYVIHEEGTGVQAQKGMNVAVHYCGMLLSDGKKFDSSFDRGEPIPFPLGMGRVIQGWDEGIALLKVGSKATLIIPYNLAYGEQGAGGVIGPKADLVFYVELVSAK